MKTFFLVLGLSLALFLSTSWLAGLSYYAAAWGQSICFFAFAWYCAHRIDRNVLSPIALISAIVIGRVLIDVVIRSIHFEYTDMRSLFVPIVSCVAVVLGVVCQREKRVSVYALSIVLLLLLNSVIHEMWISSILPAK